MILVAFALLQATAPAQNASSVQPVEAPEPEPAAVDDAPEMKMKRVCRKVMDPRVPTLASRQTVCKYVPADEDTPSKR